MVTSGKDRFRAIIIVTLVLGNLCAVGEAVGAMPTIPKMPTVAAIPTVTAGKKAGRVHVERIGQIPDILQTDPNGGLPGGGIWYCGPAAISNSLAWFSNNGYEKLLPYASSKGKAQFELARILGSAGYMNTIEGVGTDAEGVLRGVSRYIEDRGYRKYWLMYQGWGRHDRRRFGAGVRTPRLEWIKKGFIGESAVWLNAGWYTYDEKRREYTRIGEHWLTLVGYGVDKDGKEDPYILIVHDPAPRAGLEPRHTYVRLEPIRRGRMVGSFEGLPRNGRGYFLLKGDMRINKRADEAILDGAVVLKMRKMAERQK
jgi:hypothetical protein